MTSKCLIHIFSGHLTRDGNRVDLEGTKWCKKNLELSDASQQPTNQNSSSPSVCFRCI